MDSTEEIRSNGNHLEKLRGSNPFTLSKQKRKAAKLLGFQKSQDMTAAAAIARMAQKKKAEGGATSLQIEVETEMQWRTLLRREGLIVVDVYASWAGPCISMVSILKRIKIEVNDERLWYAVACSDEISDLLMFKDQSEPCWLFLGGGKPVKVFRGSHAPKLTNLIKAELAQELLCMQGKAKRTLISIDDEVSRRKKAEAEAQKLAKMIKEEDETAQELNNLRKESSIRLMGAMEPYTVLVIQNFLLETGAVTEIRDYLLGEFKIEQERYVHLDDPGVRNMFRIPYLIPDPTEPVQDFGYVDPDLDEENPVVIEDSEQDADDDMPVRKQSFTGDEDDNNALSAKAPKKKRKKLLEVKLPEGLMGDTLILLLESLEIRKMMNAGKKPDVESLLQTADDYIQLKVGPVDYKDAQEHAPYSLHAIYGQGQYLPGVWCPRRYDDKRYVLINYFPRFVTEILMPPPSQTPKYMVALFSSDKASAVSTSLELHKKDVLAEGKVSIPPDLVEQMLKSKEVTGEKYDEEKAALTGKPVYAISVDRRNSELMLAVRSNDPIHVSVDRTYGRIESAKLFEKLQINLEDMAETDAVVEKFLARSNKRVESFTVLEAKPKKKADANATESQMDMEGGEAGMEGGAGEEAGGMAAASEDGTAPPMSEEDGGAAPAAESEMSGGAEEGGEEETEEAAPEEEEQAIEEEEEEE